MSERDADRFLTRVRDWATTQADITGVLLVGSHARGQAREDSDVDLVILTHTLPRYLENPSFLERFGPAAPVVKEDWGRVTSLRIWYQSGLEVEFSFTDPGWAALPPDPGTKQVVSHGAIIVFDRRGHLAALLDAVGSGC